MRETKFGYASRGVTCRFRPSLEYGTGGYCRCFVSNFSFPSGALINSTALARVFAVVDFFPSSISKLPYHLLSSSIILPRTVQRCGAFARRELSVILGLESAIPRTYQVQISLKVGQFGLALYQKWSWIIWIRKFRQYASSAVSKLIFQNKVAWNSALIYLSCVFNICASPISRFCRVFIWGWLVLPGTVVRF